ncbi:hypothetical protein KCP91_03840 [Microvirga sp. SRT01]|uniref:Porin domain-containing protein n=1 Tax=Sphingomonas longa TaxID=2778730 RepID=A0ABS2D3M0_9SPHN|nr:MULTISPECIES: TorF family putative porin [Alphaproteobacteria]MBM6575488.1 hypothetical protein [Sphingomonas sp. BT552]MBR7708536.1 hypothetical protein [Microvirga sp. SRT01]
MKPHSLIAGAALAAASALPAHAQTGLSAGVEAATDEARRGLSWSENRGVLSADAAASLGPVDASARVVTTRGSSRHGDADAVADIGLGTGWNLGAIRVRAGGTAHLFAGARGKMDYGEVGASASFTFGPLQLTGGADYAPSQDAIGGDNLFVYAAANAGIPATPFTLVAVIGHSTGDVNDPVRAQRLRPGGDYSNWRLGVEHRTGPLTLALDYVGTDVNRRDAFGPFADARHAGDRIVGRVRFGL